MCFFVISTSLFPHKQGRDGLVHRRCWNIQYSAWVRGERREKQPNRSRLGRVCSPPLSLLLQLQSEGLPPPLSHTNNNGRERDYKNEREKKGNPKIHSFLYFIHPNQQPTKQDSLSLNPASWLSSQVIRWSRKKKVKVKHNNNSWWKRLCWSVVWTERVCVVSLFVVFCCHRLCAQLSVRGLCDIPLPKSIQCS